MRAPWAKLATLTLMAITAAGCAAAPDLEIVSRLQAIQTAFDKSSDPKDFLNVAAQYQEILDSGFVCGAVLFNQGNAFARAGQRGRAVACYKQAKRYMPRDPYLDANLRSAQGSNSAPRRSLWRYVVFWQDWISYPSKFQLTGYAALATFACGLLAMFVSPRGLWQRLAAVGVFVTVVLGVSATYDWYRYTQVRHGVVISKEVIARKGDSDSYEPAFTQPLKETMELTILETRSGWHRVRLATGQEGWVDAKAIVVY